MKKMKLNYFRTILVGFAFFLISAFWQGYDTLPITLTNKFGMSQTLSGFIMTLDNILALFLLPFFGNLSDKSKSKHGKRTPFIVIGTIIAAVAIVALSVVDTIQLDKISQYTAIDDHQTLVQIYNEQCDNELMDPDGNTFKLKDIYTTADDFAKINSEEHPDQYATHVVPARVACVAAVTTQSPNALIVFVAVLLIVLLAMSVFRSPAVALMPDVTVKPLRSKANAIINLVGTAGGVIILLLSTVLKTDATKNTYVSYIPYFGIVAGLMLTALTVFLLTVREKKWAKQMQEDTVRYGIEENEEVQTVQRTLSRSERNSLILIVLSVALWYFGYNAVTSKYSVYATKVLQMGYAMPLLLANAAAIIAYLPAGILASKIGRKNTIIIGVVMLALAFGAASFMRAGSPEWLMTILFVLAGVGWATINVNSFPMAVEMSSGADVGKYTGYYYTGSMLAQALTPMISGWLMTQFGEKVLFPYAAIFVALAIVTMLFVKHGDHKVVAKKGLEAFVVED